MRDAKRAASTIAAIIPAAGRSGRMGTPKQLLPVHGKPMVLGIIDTLLAAGVVRITLVTNSALLEKLPPLPPNVRVSLNDAPDTEMIDSIRIGVTSSGSCDGLLVCPSDAAGIAADDVRRCVDAFAKTPDKIVIATHGGRRGHPMIVPAALAAVVHSSVCDRGLNQLARQHPQRVREVACDSSGTVANVNTPADYEKLK